MPTPTLLPDAYEQFVTATESDAAAPTATVPVEAADAYEQFDALDG